MINKMSYRFFASICAMLLIIGGIIGWMSFLLFGDCAASTQVVVISSGAIAKLEKERIKNTSEDMFFGKSDEAIELIAQIGKLYEKPNVKTVFVNDDSGNCVGGVGISAQVHAAVVAKQRGGGVIKTN
jgi:hypothetical protein